MDYLEGAIEHRHVLVWSTVLLCSVAYFFLKRPRHNLPPGPSSLPIVGYLPFLGKEPHLTLFQLSKKYGNVFGLKLGSTYVVVVTDIGIARDLFSKNSTAKRSPHVFHMMPDGVGVASLSGPAWLEQRRFTIMQMKNLGFGRSSWEKLVQEEVRGLLDHLSQSGGQPVDIYPQLSDSISNNVLSLATGRPVSQGGVIDRGIDAFMAVHNQSGILSFYPTLFRTLAKLGFVKIHDSLARMAEMNQYIRSIVEELKQEEGPSYVHTYLKEMEKNDTSSLTKGFNESNLIGNVQALIIGGNDTTKVSLQWLLLAMAAFPDIQNRIHQELDSVLGKDQSVEWGDRLRLPHCHAAILEGQRWRTVAPLNLLHSTTEDTTVGEYVIPKDSDIIASIWAFHNDPRHWEDPEVFRPERFLTKDGQVAKNLGSYAPFSFGKRICIGETVAFIELFLYFVGILQKFRILPAKEGASPNLNGRTNLVYTPERQPLRFIQR